MVCNVFGGSWLKQSQWSSFFEDLKLLVDRFADEVHFTGFSLPNAKWQNACVVCVMDESDIDIFKHGLSRVGWDWNQDSIAVTCGETTFVKSDKH